MSSARKEDEYYTYEDYYSWDDGLRWELIYGKAYAMSPAASRRHQEISGELFSQLHEFLRGHSCKVYHAPFDVRLNADTDDDTVVQPDIVIVCDPSKLNDRGCAGVPDMVVEILSPSSIRMDKHIKFEAYKKAGVLEYWIVDPESNLLDAYILNNGDYIAQSYSDSDDNVPVHVLEGCSINLVDVFGV
ncbi:MAG: Uma2 family endonuclease [Oscillospiraceae bacterium]|nr:Uma2 family endonuclease [Oscillospiraceae bacterium]